MVCGVALDPQVNKSAPLWWVTAPLTAQRLSGVPLEREFRTGDAPTIFDPLLAAQGAGVVRVEYPMRHGARPFPVAREALDADMEAILAFRAEHWVTLESEARHSE